MTPIAAVQWRKEVRELLPWWSGTAATMLMCWSLMHPDAMPFDSIYSFALLRDRNVLLGAGLWAYALGAMILGALPLGHEYAHNTLPAFLTHPVGRGRLLLVKLTVLAAMLIALGALAFGVWGAEPALVENLSSGDILKLGLLPIVCGLFLAPWLTMVGRGPLAGAVFTLIGPSLLWVLSASLRSLMWPATIGLGAVGAVMTWRTFMRLEASGRTQGDVDLSSWFAGSSADTRASRQQGRAWVLINKELRLQQTTFVISGLFVATCAIVLTGRQMFAGAESDGPLFIATFLNSGLVPLLAGATAIAEERRLGVADWHALLPIASWKQWSIKAAVAVGMTIVLAVLVPSFVATVAAEPGMRDGMEPMTVVMLCVAALYVSSLTTNSLRALLLTSLGIPMVLLFGLMMSVPAARWLRPAVQWIALAVGPFVEVDAYDSFWWRRHGILWLIGGFGLVLLYFSYANQRTSDRRVGRLAKQLGLLLAYTTAAAVFFFVILQVWENGYRATRGL